MVPSQAACPPNCPPIAPSHPPGARSQEDPAGEPGQNGNAFGLLVHVSFHFSVKLQVMG